MGLPMPGIHEPTIPSSTVEGNSETSFAELLAQKDRIETELKALASVLESHGVNMNTTLTTFDGFPRSDVDVAQIRTTRARIIPLRNDYKALMTRLEAAVHTQFASQTAAPPPASSTTSRSNTTAASSRTDETPFARVDSVVPGSPAEAAGLKAGDMVQRFGDANWLNHEKLARVAQIVGQSEGRPVTVRVRRRGTVAAEDAEVEIVVTPRRGWGGRGLLGCHLLPL